MTDTNKLPKPRFLGIQRGGLLCEDGYTADQMHEFRRQGVAEAQTGALESLAVIAKYLGVDERTEKARPSYDGAAPVSHIFLAAIERRVAEALAGREGAVATPERLLAIIAAVPDIGDKAAREFTIARMAAALAHPAAQPAPAEAVRMVPSILGGKPSPAAPSAPAPAQGEREHYEAWWASATDDDMRDIAWSAWKARAALAAQPGSELVAAVKYVPVDSKPRDKNGCHPNDSEPRTAACLAALDERGDGNGQGLDGYWKWGFAAGFNAALAVQPAAPADVLEEAMRRADGQAIAHASHQQQLMGRAAQSVLNITRDRANAARAELRDFLAKHLSAQPAAAPEPVAGWEQGVKAAAAWVDARRRAFDAKHGHMEQSTGAVIFNSSRNGQEQEEHSNELRDIASGIRTLAAAPGREA